MTSAGPAQVKLRAAMLTDVGVVRDHNEDAAHIDEDHMFFVVADGMGGHAAGEVASAMAVDTVRQALKDAETEIREFAHSPTEDGRKNIVNILESAVRAAHKAVFERGSSETDKQGMGTTLDVVLVAGPEAFVAHVGDSRTYLLRDGRAAQITTDHTVAEVLVIEGKLSIEEAQISPLRTILVNAIGVAPDVGVEMAHVQLRKDDHLLLCSDGLHDYFPIEQELADHILDSTPDDALTGLIQLAKERGGHDNITGVLLEVVECAPAGDGAVASTASPDLSDGVPAPIDRDDTLPVDAGDDAPAGDATAGDDADDSKAGKKKSRKSAAKSEAKGEASGPKKKSKDADGGKKKPKRVRTEDGEKDRGSAAMRSTDPMEAVDPEDADADDD